MPLKWVNHVYSKQSILWSFLKTKKWTCHLAKSKEVIVSLFSKNIIHSTYFFIKIQNKIRSHKMLVCLLTTFHFLKRSGFQSIDLILNSYTKWGHFLWNFAGKAKLGERKSWGHNWCEVALRAMQHEDDAKDGTTWAEMCCGHTKAKTHNEPSLARTSRGLWFGTKLSHQQKPFSGLWLLSVSEQLCEHQWHWLSEVSCWNGKPFHSQHSLEGFWG